MIADALACALADLGGPRAVEQQLGDRGAERFEVARVVEQHAAFPVDDLRLNAPDP